MYLSHPVRRMRDDPDERGTARLVVETADAGPDLAAVLPDLDGEVVREGRFATVVELPERRVAALVALDGLERVETADTLGLGLDPDRPGDGGGAATADATEPDRDPTG